MSASFAGALACAGGALAQVIELSPDGAAVTYAAPTVFTAEGASAIVPERTRLVSTPDEVLKTIGEAAERQQISGDLLQEVARRESGFRQGAVSSKNAVGVMQLTAATAKDLGVDRHDLAQNIHGGATYLRRMLDRYRGDVQLALAAYNAGPGAVDRYGGVPPYRETQGYVAAILGGLARRSASGLVPIKFSP